MDEPEIHLLRYREHGEDRHFARFVTERTDLVWSVALRKLGGCRALAEEVVQTVFADVVGRLHSLDLSKPLTAWLVRHTQLKAAELARKERRRSRREERYGEDWRAEAEDKAPADSGTEAARLLDQLLLTMSAQDRQAVLLRYYEKRPLEEVADCMGSTPEAVRKRISRALDAVRLKLGKLGITSSTALLSTTLVGCTVQAAPAGTAASAAGYGLAHGASAAGWLQDFFTTIRHGFRVSHVAAALAGGAAVAATVPLWHQPAPPAPAPALVSSAPKAAPAARPSAPAGSGVIPISTKAGSRAAASPKPAMGFPGMMGADTARRELVRRWKEPLQLSAAEEQSLDQWLTARMDELQAQARQLMAQPGMLTQLLREGDAGNPEAEEQLRKLTRRPDADAVGTWAAAHLDEPRLKILIERQKTLRETEAEALATRMMTEIDRSATLDEEQKNAVFHYYHDSALSRAELLEEEALGMMKPPADLPPAPPQRESEFLQATLRPEQNTGIAETKRAAAEMFEKTAEEMGKTPR